MRTIKNYTAKQTFLKRPAHMPMHMELKATNDTMGTFSGLLSTSDKDMTGDVVARGAYTKTLSDLNARKQSRKSPFILPLLWSHDPSLPIGGISSAVETDRGLLITASLDIDIERGREAFSLIKKGIVSGLSIGYRVEDSDRLRDGTRLLKALTLVEGSVVCFPANTNAVIDLSSVKGDISNAALSAGLRDIASQLKTYVQKRGLSAQSNTETNTPMSINIIGEKQYNSITASEVLNCSPLAVNAWIERAMVTTGISASKAGTGYTLDGFSLAELASNHATDLKTLWIQRGIPTDQYIDLTTGHVSNNSAFIESLQTSREERADKAAPDSDYEDNSCRCF